MNCKTLPLTLLFAATLASCSSKIFYQVYQTQSNTVNVKGDHVVSYENDHCRVSYDLWSDHGDAGFTFYNKTNEVIRLQLDESFYVMNGVAYDYFQNRTFISGSNAAISQSAGTGFGSYGIINAFSSTVVDSKTNSMEVTEVKVIAIPPKTAKRISEFDITRSLYRDCDLLKYPSARKVITKSFTSENSPLKFYNTISYTLGSSDLRQKITNDFYVTGITNYPEKELMKSVHTKFCGEKDAMQKKKMTGISPDKFYLKYQKKESDNQKH